MKHETCKTCMHLAFGMDFEPYCQFFGYTTTGSSACSAYELLDMMQNSAYGFTAVTDRLPNESGTYEVIRRSSISGRPSFKDTAVFCKTWDATGKKESYWANSVGAHIDTVEAWRQCED